MANQMHFRKVAENLKFANHVMQIKTLEAFSKTFATFVRKKEKSACLKESSFHRVPFSKNAVNL